MDFRRLIHALGVGGLAVTAACSVDNPVAAPSPDLAPSFSTTSLKLVALCKVGEDAGTVGQTFDFNTEATGGTVLAPTITRTAVAAGDLNGDTFGDHCKLVWQGSATEAGTDVTITELLPDGFDLSFVRIWEAESFLSDGSDYVDVTPTDGSATFSAGDGKVVVFYNREDDNGGGAGCTPGFWRQDHHYDRWSGYDPSDVFSDVFGVGPDISLAEAVWAGGGGESALIRHAVAALLNAASADVAYDLSEAVVIAAVQEAFGLGEFEEIKDLFEGLNEQGCDLD